MVALQAAGAVVNVPGSMRVEPPTAGAPPALVPRVASIRLKLFLLVSAVVIGVATLLAAYFASRQVALLERTVVEKGNFVAQQLRTAIAFADRETAREVFEAAHNAREVLHLALFASDGRLVHADGNGALVAPAPAVAPRLEDIGGRLRVVAPVVSQEGPRGTLVVEIDRARLDAEIRAVRIGAAAIGAAGLLLGCLAAFLVGRAFSRRIERIRRVAAAVATGNLDQPRIDGGSNDEIGQLATAFNTMVDNLRFLVLKLSETSAQLEGASDSFLDIVRGQGEDTRGTVDGLVPGFMELRQYADDLNKLIVKFEVVDGER
jgi:methyl-accepting chemotaxis protein